MNRREAIRFGVLLAAAGLVACKKEAMQTTVTARATPTAENTLLPPVKQAEEVEVTEEVVVSPTPTSPPTEIVMPSATVRTPENTPTPERLRPEVVKGVYFPLEVIWREDEVKRRLESMASIGANSAVVEIQSEAGRCLVRVDHPLRSEGDYIDDPENLVRFINLASGYGIHVIARQVVMANTRLAKIYPGIGMRDTQGREMADSTGNIWLNPMDPMVAEYNAAVARGVKEMGIRELQLDYIRWPFDVSNLYDLPTRVAPILAIISAVKTELGEEALLTVDFLEWSVRGGDENYDGGVGQCVKLTSPLIHGLCPMLYPDIYAVGVGVDEYQAVLQGTLEAKRRLLAGGNDKAFVNPWIQGYYSLEEEAEIEAQMRGAFDGGAVGVHVWNTSWNYPAGALVEG